MDPKDSKIERISACWPRGAEAMKREMEVCKAQARSWIWPLGSGKRSRRVGTVDP